MSNKEKLIAFVRETSRLATEAGIVERAKASKGISKATGETYFRIAEPRIDLGAAGLGRLMEGVSGRSWHTTRAALLCLASLKFEHCRRECDKAQRSGDLARAQQMAGLARRCVEAFEKVKAATRPDPAGERRTKRRTLPKSEVWQERVHEAATPAQRSGVAVLWATGCRPAELEAGVEVVRRVGRNGRVVFEATITGAKVTKHSGQPTRVLKIQGESAAGRALAGVLGDQEQVVVRRGAKRLNADFADIRERTGLKVSPYSMRHQLAASLKAELGREKADEVAAALGHATTRSQGRYGSVRQAQKGGSGVVAIRGKRPVKETRPTGSSGPATRPPAPEAPRPDW